MSKQQRELEAKNAKAVQKWLVLGHTIFGGLAVAAAFREPLVFGDVIPKLRAGQVGFRCDIAMRLGSAHVVVAIVDAGGHEVGRIFEYRSPTASGGEPC